MVQPPDTVTFTIDRAADNQSLLDLGGTATMSVYADDVDAGTSLTLVDRRPITNSATVPTDPAVSVDPSQLTMGHTTTSVWSPGFGPAGVLANMNVWYSNFRLKATAEDTDGDGAVDNSDNCPNDANPGQENNDGDAQGDVCDTDDDNDGVARQRRDRLRHHRGRRQPAR